MQPRRIQFKRGSNANDPRDPFEQNMFLQYKDKDLEAKFVAFIHSVPFKALPIGLTMSFFVNILLNFYNPDLDYEVTVAWYAMVSTTSITLHCLADEKRMARVLYCERLVFSLTACFSTTQDLYTTLQQFRRCDLLEEIRFDDRKAFEDPHCHRWWSPLGVCIIAILAVVQIIPFSMVIAACLYTVVIYLTMWLFIPPPDPLLQVWLFAIYATAGLAFIAYVRYDQEQVQRKQFMRYYQLQQEEERLAVKQRTLADYCAALLPAAMLKRIGTYDFSAPLDQTDAGTVLLVGVHDFSIWCTQQRPINTASGVVLLQITVRTFAAKHGIDFVGTMGDTIVVTGNLIQPVDDVINKTRHVCRDVLLSHESHELPPCRGVVHSGQLSGGFVGSLSARYDVFGPALDVAKQALLECPADRIAGSEAFAIGHIPEDAVQYTTQKHHFVALDCESYCEDGTLIVSKDQDQNEIVHIEFGGDGNTLAGIEAAMNQSANFVASSTSNPLTAAMLPDKNTDADSMIPQQYQPDGEESLVQHIANYKRETKVWCCFPRFADDAVEQAYVEERMEALPGAASRTWFAYALFVLVILILLLVDMSEPNGIIGVILLTVAIFVSVLMGAAPMLLGKKRMREWFFPWSVVGVVLPLLCVYGTAVTRPSAVGNDARLFLFIGALVRSYCFTSSRWQAIFVPLCAVLGLGEYALPGGYIRIQIVFVIILIVIAVVADKEREQGHRDNVRRKFELRLVLVRLKQLDRLRDGLMNSALPKQLVPFVRERVSGAPESLACQVEGAALAIRATMRSGSQPASRLAVAAQRFARLEELLSATRMLSVGSILGDQAIVVGPVTIDDSQYTRKECDVALVEALQLGVDLVQFNDEPDAAVTFGVVMDYDSTVHAVQVADFAQYWALGVTVTRLLTFMAATDAADHPGCLITERVAMPATELGALQGLTVVEMGRMKLRGLGIVRLSRVSCPSAPKTESLSDGTAESDPITVGVPESAAISFRSGLTSKNNSHGTEPSVFT